MQTAASKKRYKKGKFSSCYIVFLWEAGSEEIRYSMPEETESGSCGQPGKDLGLRVGNLGYAGRANPLQRKQTALAAGYNDREFASYEKLGPGSIVPGNRSSCILHFQLLLENPVQIIQADLQLTDVNDHSLEFLERETLLKSQRRPRQGLCFL